MTPTDPRFAAAHAEAADDICDGMGEREREQVHACAARIAQLVCGAGDVGEQEGIVADSFAFQVAVLRLALQTTEAMEGLLRAAESDR